MIKLTFKHLLVVSMILTLFLGLSLVSATDVTDDSAVSTKNICTHSITSDNNDNIDVNDINNYAKNTFTSTSANNGSNSDENINNGNTVGDSNGGSISELKDKIDAGGSSIILDTDYTYSDSSDSGLTGGIVVSRDLTIDGQGHTIDLGGKIRFLNSTTSGINLVLKNLIIKNGKAPNDDNGGAVYIENGNGSFINSTFTGNNAEYGGAVSIRRGNGIFIDSTFTGNNASMAGAVSIGTGNGSFINSTFTSNNATNSGGAVYIYGGNGSFINSTFTGNKANRFSGAVSIEESNGIFIGSTFTSNNAGDEGGAVYIYGGNGSFINSTFTSNNATTSGGAVSIGTGNGSFINSTFTSNNAGSTDGGAVYISTGNGSFINSTFISNHAILSGGAVGIFDTSYVADFVNSTFMNNTSDNNGGAVSFSSSSGSFINSTFTGNNASNNGGAVYISNGNCNIINSTFTGNNASNRGGAVFLRKSNGTAILCRFNTESDTICYVTVIPASINVLNYTSTYQSGEKLEFNLTADEMVFDGFNTTINIFKDGELVKTVYALTGEGWIVDLNPGVYTAVLSLTDYPAEKSSNATLNISKANTTVVIDPIVDAVLGKEVLINFTTNSNGTATIKVNGVPINSATFTPTHAGTYNVTVEVAENDYYTAGSAETNFTVEKINTTVVIDPIVDAILGKEVLINFTTNSNGTATIKVNGVPINNATFTPTQVGTYNVTVEVAENDYYTAGSAETNFTVEKLASSIIADAVSTTYTVDKFLVISLKDSNGNPISGADLSVNLRGIKNYTTNEDGQVLINIAKLYPKTYNAVISYEGSDNFNGSTGSAKVTVNKITSSIIAKSPTFKLNQNIKKYTITLKYLSGKLLANKKVVLNFNGKTYAVKTNNKGQGVFKIYKHLKKGVYNAVITVPENSYYNKVIKKVKITVK